MRRRGKERKERKRERQKQIKNLSGAANNHQMGFLQILELFLQSVPQKLQTKNTDILRAVDTTAAK
jgi:hypothetical protein